MKDEYFASSYEVKPREKVKRYGIESLSDDQLLALILETGTIGENVIPFCKRILYEKGGLYGLFLNGENYEGIKGIGEAKRCRLLAIREMYRRLPLSKKEKVFDASEAVEATKGIFMESEEEILVALYLQKDKTIIQKEEIRSFHPKEVSFPVTLLLRHALRNEARYVILLHNHPSGSFLPSESDLIGAVEVFDLLFSAGIILYDSLIVSTEGFYSMRDNREGPYSFRESEMRLREEKSNLNKP